MLESPYTTLRISLVASTNLPSSGSLYRLFIRFSYFIIAFLLAGEYGIATDSSIGISRPREGGKGWKKAEILRILDGTVEVPP